jgi:hypothetical protein
MMIWQYAWYHDELDHYLSHAEQLLIQWSVPNLDTSSFEGEPHAFFSNPEDFQFALYLLHDDLLPIGVQKLVCLAILSGRAQLREKKTYNEYLMVGSKVKPGRPREPIVRRRTNQVIKLIKEGVTKTKAIEQVAEEYHKSKDTIRREYERSLKANKHLWGKLK